MTPATIDNSTLAELGELFAALSALTKNYQIYGFEHPRTQEAWSDYKQRAGNFRKLAEVDDELIVAYHDGRFFYEHIPMVVSPQQAYLLVSHLETNQMAGFRLSLDLPECELESLLKLLSVQPSSRHSVVAAKIPGFRWLRPDEVHRMESASSRERLNLHLILQLPELRIEEDIYVRTLGTLASFMQESSESELEDMGSIRYATDELVEQFISSPDGLMPLTTLPYSDNFIYHHSLNVSLIALKAASLVVSDPSQLRRIGQAALLHDLGKTAIPPEILFKPGALTDTESALVMKHPVIGARRLAQSSEVDPLAAAVAFGHHIKDHGEGYPKVGSGYQIGPVTALIEVADMFEAMTSQRPYKKAITAASAFGNLYSMSNMKSFRPQIDLLARAIGFQPVGSRVRGADGDLGIVVGHDQGDPRRPQVRRVCPEEGGTYRLEDARTMTGAPHPQEPDENTVVALDPDEDFELHG